MAIPNWLTISQLNGSGDTIITVTAATYDEFIERSSSLVISGNTKSVNLPVYQSGIVNTITVSPSSLTFIYEGGTATFTITSNSSWTITNYPAWLSLSATAGTSGTTTVTATATTNASFNRRNGTMVVSGITTAQNVSVVQDGLVATLTVNPTSLVWDENGGSRTVSVTSNYGWNISGNTLSSAMTISPVSGGSGTTTVTVTAPQNTMSASRVGSFVVYNDSNSVRVSMHQTGQGSDSDFYACTYYVNSNNSLKLYSTSYEPNYFTSMSVEGGAWESPSDYITPSDYGKSTGQYIHVSFKVNLSDSLNVPNTSVPPYHFRDTTLYAVTLPNFIDGIYGDAFYGTMLTGLTLPNTIKYIGAYSLPTAVTIADASNLTDIELHPFALQTPPQNKIGGWIVNGNDYNGVTGVAKTVIYNDLPSNAVYFANESITAYTTTSGATLALPSSFDIAPDYAPGYAYPIYTGPIMIDRARIGIQTITGPYVQQSRFVIKNGILYDVALYGATDLVIPNGVVECRAVTMSATTLTSITFPSTMEVYHATGRVNLMYCSNLTRITFGSGIKQIKSSWVGRYCQNLTAIYCYAQTAPEIYLDTFQYFSGPVTLYVPANSTGYEAWFNSGYLISSNLTLSKTL